MQGSSRIDFVASSFAAWTIILLLFFAHEAGADVDPATGRSVGDVSARNFSKYCDGELPAHRRRRFDSAFAEAEAALVSGSVADAEAAMGRAFSAIYRGGAESELSIKCLGESVARRWWKARLEIDRRRSKQSSPGRPARVATLRATAVDRGASAVVAFVSAMKPRHFVSSVRSLEAFVDRLDAERRYGAFVLSEEESMEASCREALDILRRHAAREHRDALALEEPIFERASSERERTASDLAADAGAIVEALAGEDLDSGLDGDQIVLRNRVRESRERLHAARTWNLEIVADQRTLPSSRRAKRRGDEMLARAKRAGTSLEGRAAAYDAAMDYYAFGGFVDDAEAVAAERAKLEDALLAERAKREEKLERAADEMKQEAESMKRSVDDMMKSESQKKAFDDEAKALEEELGF